MRKTIMRELLAEYDQQQLRNAQDFDRRRAEVTAVCPEIGAVLQARQDLIFDSVRGILDGAATAEDIPARMAALNERLSLLLKQNGYEDTYLDPRYRCPRCRDTGYVGEPIREQCECLRTAFFSRLYRMVGLGEQSSQSFDSFRLDLFSEELLPGKTYSQRALMNAIHRECRHYADNYPNSKTRDLLLMGQSGLGKTFLMHAMAKVLLERGFSVLLISSYRFLDTARKAYFGNGSAEMESLMDVDILMVDDMGTEPLMENVTIVQWFNLINERQQRGKGTVISTNLMEDELRARYTERIASRLLNRSQCTTLLFLGDDVRRRRS